MGTAVYAGGGHSPVCTVFVWLWEVGQKVGSIDSVTDGTHGGHNDTSQC